MVLGVPEVIPRGSRSGTAVLLEPLEPLREDVELLVPDERDARAEALDALTRYRLQGLAAELLEDRTVLLVTHDPNEALRLGHRIHVLSGRPARLDSALEPPGTVPRDPAEEPLRALYRELMQRLGLEQPRGR